MELWWILSAAVAAAVILVPVAAYICFRMAFYAKNKPRGDGEITLPPGEIYEPYHEAMRGWIREVRAMPCVDFTVRSFDGLTLHGRYYEYAPSAPVELMMPGYRGDAQRDLCGGVQRCFSLGHSALIVDQRACGQSEGHVITFGVNESRDCRTWVKFMVEHFGKDVRIILTGISMGAATVLLAASRPLPEQVIGVLADCGYTSAGEMIRKTIREMKLPPRLLYPIVRLGARLYGGFDPDEAAPLEAMAGCRLPVIFFHGEADDFVPCEMSRRNYETCPTHKALYTVPGAGHGLSYPADAEGYLQAMRTFFEPYGA